MRNGISKSVLWVGRILTSLLLLCLPMDIVIKFMDVPKSPWP